MAQEPFLDVFLLELPGQKSITPQEDLSSSADCQHMLIVTCVNDHYLQIIGDMLESEQSFNIESTILLISKGFDPIVEVDE